MGARSSIHAARGASALASDCRLSPRIAAAKRAYSGISGLGRVRESSLMGLRPHPQIAWAADHALAEHDLSSRLQLHVGEALEENLDRHFEFAAGEM